MHVKLVGICFFSFLFSLCITLTTYAVEIDSSITITKEEAVELAIKDHVNFRILEAKINALRSQGIYIENKLNDLDYIGSSTTSKLPIDVEFFINQYPEYEQLTDEEKNAMEQVISTQILINTSLNQLLDKQDEIRNHELQEQIKLQREELERTAQTLDANKNKNIIELEQTKEAIKSYISQKYINLLLLNAEIEQLETELLYFQNDIQDLLIMKEHGLISDRDVEKKNSEIQELKYKLNEKERTYNFYIEELKLELGLSYSQDVYLQPIDIEMNKLPIKELENKVNNMFNLRKLEEDILLAEKNYNSVDSEEIHLKDYHYNIWQATKLEKDKLIKEITTEIKQLYFEQEAIFTHIEELQKEKESLILVKKDVEVQLKAGLITSIEVEKVDREIQRIKSDINVYKHQYYVLNEKYIHALNGYLE